MKLGEDRYRELVESAAQAAGNQLPEAVPAIRQQILDALEKRQGISQETANLKTKSGKGAKAVKEASKRYPDAWVRIANQVAIAVRYTQRRGYYLFRSQIVTDDSSTAVHEYAHHLQAMLPDLDAVFQEEHRRRTQGDPVEILYPHVPREKGRPDKYYERYMGREYSGRGALEVMSMALQPILGTDEKANRMFAKLLKEDPAMVKLVLGLLFHYRP